MLNLFTITIKYPISRYRKILCNFTDFLCHIKKNYLCFIFIKFFSWNYIPEKEKDKISKSRSDICCSIAKSKKFLFTKVLDYTFVNKYSFHEIAQYHYSLPIKRLIILLIWHVLCNFTQQVILNKWFFFVIFFSWKYNII